MWRRPTVCCVVVLLCLCISTIKTNPARAVEIECIPVKLCPLAMKLIKTKPFANSTISFLRYSHCGFDGKEAKIWCSKFKFCITPDSRNGTCTPIRQCHPYMKMLQTLDVSNPITKKYLREFRCTTEFDTNIDVCCPQEKYFHHEHQWPPATTYFHHEHRWPRTTTSRYRHPYPTTTSAYAPPYLTTTSRYAPPYSSTSKFTPSYFTTTPPYSDVHDRFADPVLEICGKQIGDNRIVGGVEAELGEFPWMALIKYKNGDNYTFGCAGSLVNARYVLTAAHCLDPYIIRAKGLGKLYSVVLGEHDTRYDTDCVKVKYGEDCADPVREVRIADTITHPGYSSRFVKDDLALIKLSERIHYTDYIKPICLPWKSMKFNESVFFTIAGWGRTGEGKNESQSPIKRKARVPYREKKACDTVRGRALSEAQICAGYGNGTDNCFGDSGGPLMLQKAVDSDFITYVIGIISYGYGGRCGEYPSVHTYVPHYVDWIHKIIT